MTIAILEDVAHQANAVAGLLRKCGYNTIILSNGDNFINYITEHEIDLMLLDWDVPGKNGIEVLRWTRSNLPDHLPILMMTQHDGEEDIVFALDEGADDYLIKPISDRQLVARVNAQIRKTNSFFGRKNTTATHDEKITVGKYLLDVSARIVYINEENASHEKSIIHLPDREMQLAKLLFSNVGRIVNKDYLIRHIWECAPDRKYDPSLSTYISKLRKLLLLNIENDLIISTIYNYGYRLEYV